MFKIVAKHLALVLSLGVVLISTTHAGEQSTKDLFAPVFVNCSEGGRSFYHCDTARLTFKAVSAATGLPSMWVRYRLVSGPGTIDSITGEWKMGPIADPDSIGRFTVEVGASELGLETEGLQNCRTSIYSYVYPIYVQVTDPNFTGLELSPGQSGEVHFRYEPVSQCDSGWTFLAGIRPSFVGNVEYNDNNGRATLSVIPDSLDAGTTFEFIVGSTSGPDTNLFRVPLIVKAYPAFAVQVKTISHQLQGRFTEVPVTLAQHPDNQNLGGLNLLFAYDNSALSLQAVTNDSAGIYRDCKWEYFTYRFGPTGNCSGGCPGGLVRVMGLAETNNGDFHPVCGPDYVPSGVSELFRMKFLTSNNRNFSCTWSPIRFFWDDCGDNTLIAYDGSRLFMEQTVWEIDSLTDKPTQLDSTLAGFPGYSGILPGACQETISPGRFLPQRSVAFFGGGIEFMCAESVDARCKGDINLNALPNEVADYVAYQNYLLYGLSALGSIQYSLGCTDINGDGVPLTIADLTYLNLIGRGNALPFSKYSADTSANLASVGVADNPPNRVWLGTLDTLAAICMVFRGEVSFNHWTAGLTWRSNFDGTVTHLLISPPDFDSFPRITSGWIMQAAASSDSMQPAELLSVEAATNHGNPVRVQYGAITDVKDHSGNLPSKFALHQNYPNPFNAGTVIKCDLPNGSDVSLDVLNVLGQAVWSSTRHYSAGSHQIEWNGTGYGGRMVSSGVYYYRLRAGTYSETKKMVLLK